MSSVPTLYVLPTDGISQRGDRPPEEMSPLTRMIGVTALQNETRETCGALGERRGSRGIGSPGSER